jgi:hypothetical protein
MGQVSSCHHFPSSTRGRKMKTVAEIVAAIILLASSGYLVPKAVKIFKIETMMKVDKGLSPIQNFTNKLDG